MSVEAMKQALEALDDRLSLMKWQAAREALRQAIEQAEKQEPIKIDGNTSDGYHTFNELYEFRKAYNVALFNEWASGGKCSVHKSWRHHDGELCFGGGWFIVVAVLPQGQISNHYEAKDWNLFAIPEVERALFEFDGHTGNDVIERLEAYTTPQPQQAFESTCSETLRAQGKPYPRTCKKCGLGPCIGKPQREWQSLTDEEIDQGLLRSDYALQTAHAWRAGVVFAMTQLKEKNT